VPCADRRFPGGVYFGRNGHPRRRSGGCARNANRLGCDSFADLRHCDEPYVAGDPLFRIHGPNPGKIADRGGPVAGHEPDVTRSARRVAVVCYPGRRFAGRVNRYRRGDGRHDDPDRLARIAEKRVCAQPFGGFNRCCWHTGPDYSAFDCPHRPVRSDLDRLSDGTKGTR